MALAFSSTHFFPTPHPPHSWFPRLNPISVSDTRQAAAVAAENEEVTSPAPDRKPKAYPLSHDVSLWGCPTLGHSGLS